MVGAPSSPFIMHVWRLYRVQQLSIRTLNPLLSRNGVPTSHVQRMWLNTPREQPKELTPENDKRIIYNCMLTRLSKYEAQQLHRRMQRARWEKQQPESSLPASVFLSISSSGSVDTSDSAAQSGSESLSPAEVTFPYASPTPVQFTDAPRDREPADEPLPANTRLQQSVRERVRLLREQAVREEAAAADGADQDELWVLRYGRPDPSVPVSRSVCGGCGAHLHCQEPAWPGYLPAEVLRAAPERELRDLVCQRCYFLRFHQTAVNVTVPAADYSLLMRRMGDWPALLVLVVDLLDFPCSVWSGIGQLVGRSRPVIIVGNKVDLLPQDSDGYLARVTASLSAALERCGVDRLNVKHTCLVSARTGYGIEELVTVIQTHWAAQGDVYLMGCTNVGKSTLFNALLQSDLCKSTAHDLIRRATTSRWPGTTLNLLKFPMMRPQEFHLQKRRQRLQREKNWAAEEQRLRHSQLMETKQPRYAMLTGHIGRTFRGERARDGEAAVLGAAPEPEPERIGGVAADDPRFPTGRWVYDTPGFVSADQLLGQLTQQELLLTLGRQLLRPRTFSLAPGQSLFVAGLARLDYRAGPSNARLTVFASGDLPVTVTATEDAAAIYREYLQSGLFVVPCGGADRFSRWPELEPRELTVTGGSLTESAADIVLSSAGWVAVTPAEDRSGGNHKELKFTAHTPGGAGVFVRSPPVLPYAVRLRGRRQRDSPAHRVGELYQLREARR
ncbi:nitric oxide-associated protein 1-like [Amphibalanus amphitrite]|uniref:nitric oxide-associated protein 1-like n=1 Tax=Amphibalanus amphitrite TaxID=1232801 RepID=UPI001C916C12|nr:nitric oxide-associated protein 1-like [Amphibalanus amphitrite]XP_043225456.1 nitric oxide-associated protein 1-like [Amphibalanus amphitrite]